MHIDFLKDVFRKHSKEEAFIWRGSSYSFAWLLDRISSYHEQLDGAAPGARSVVMLHADFSPFAVAAMLCLIERSAIVIPLAPGSEARAPEFRKIARVEFDLRITGEGALDVDRTGETSDHELFRRLAERRHPGLVLFSSGSTGVPKGVVHDLALLMKKYRTRRHCYRTLAFLLFDHIGGIDTAFYSLSNGSSLVLCDDRTPDGVCKAIEEHRVQVLPAAPSFLNLLALSGAHARYDLSTLKYVTYGAELMPMATLERCNSMFPGVTLMQKYGTSEVGTLRSRSKSSASLWVKLGGEGYETRVVDGRLEIRADSSMLGYLNAEGAFTADGWFQTGDCVEVDGEYIRFLGRESDIINVGGQKVYPAEVEGVIGALENIEEVVVFGEDNAIMGQVVRARVRLVEEEDLRQLTRRIRKACIGRLDRYKIPMAVELSDAPLTTDRFKLRRRDAK